MTEPQEPTVTPADQLAQTLLQIFVMNVSSRLEIRRLLQELHRHTDNVGVPERDRILREMVSQYGVANRVCPLCVLGPHPLDSCPMVAAS